VSGWLGALYSLTSKVTAGICRSPQTILTCCGRKGQGMHACSHESLKPFVSSGVDCPRITAWSLRLRAGTLKRTPTTSRGVRTRDPLMTAHGEESRSDKGCCDSTSTGTRLCPRSAGSVNKKTAVEGKGRRWEGKDEEHRFAKDAVRWCG